jgi:gluconate 2-dehydrogenase alpha chain
VQRQGIDDYNGENAFEEKMDLSDDDFFIRGAFIGSPSQRNPLETYDQIPPDVPRWGQAYKDYLTENLNRYIGLQLLTGADAVRALALSTSTPTTATCTASRRTRHPPAKRERAAHGALHPRAARWRSCRRRGPRASGVRDVPGDPALDDPRHRRLRMGDDPTTSVTNRYCQMWTAPNVFVGGAAVFPTMAGKNPTETIWMLSYWLSDAITQGRVDLEDAENFA